MKETSEVVSEEWRRVRVERERNDGVLRLGRARKGLAVNEEEWRKAISAGHTTHTHFTHVSTNLTEIKFHLNIIIIIIIISFFSYDY